MFNTIDMRIGRVMSAAPFLGARKPAYKLEVDLGPLLGVKKSSAQLTAGYPEPAQLVGRLVVAVVNFAPRSIAGFKSEVLVTGFYADDRRVFLLEPACNSISPYPVGGRVFSTCPLKETTLLPVASIDQFISLNKIHLGRVVEVGEADVILDCGSGIGARIKCPMPASERTPIIGDLNALLLREASSQEADLLVTAEGSLLTSDASVPLGTLLA